MSARTNGLVLLAGAMLASDGFEIPHIFSDAKPTPNQFNENFAALAKEMQGLVPVGTIVAYATDRSIPDGWLLCDGSEKPVDTYPELAGLLADRWKNESQLRSGEKFLVPDLRGVFLRGVDLKTDGATSGRDSDGVRAVGHFQPSMVGPHDHPAKLIIDDKEDKEDGKDDEAFTVFAGQLQQSEHAGTMKRNGIFKKVTVRVEESLAPETRPVNCAVRYIVRAR